MDQTNHIEHDQWAYHLPKTRTAGKVTVGEIHGVLPFGGARNPITTSSVSYKAMLVYKTAANDWKPKVGATESGAEQAVAEEALVSPDIFDVEFQPVQFSYTNTDGKPCEHTIDLRLTYRNGLRRFVFVRNHASLVKPKTHAEIDAIASNVPRGEADEFVVVDGDAYSRPRRENLRRMHRLVAFQPDPLADRMVLEAIESFRTLWLMSDLQKVLDLSPARIFQSSLRLIAAGRLGANMDAVICQHSRIWIAAK